MQFSSCVVSYLFFLLNRLVDSYFVLESDWWQIFYNSSLYSSVCLLLHTGECRDLQVWKADKFGRNDLGVGVNLNIQFLIYEDQLKVHSGVPLVISCLLTKITLLVLVCLFGFLNFEKGGWPQFLFTWNF